MRGVVTSSPRDNKASILVSALSAGFGVVLIGGTGILSTVVGSSSGGDAVRLPLATVSTIFFVISLYVGAIVTSNTFSTIIAGRRRQIALMRSIGATSRQQRRMLAREGLRVGVAGAVVGGACGAIVVAMCVPLLITFDVIPADAYPILSWGMLLPVGAVVLTTWIASWAGGRAILAVSPIDALGMAQQSNVLSKRRRRTRLWLSVPVVVVGAAVLALGALLPQLLRIEGPSAATLMAASIFVAFVGGLISFTGVLLCAPVFVPRLLAVTAKVFGASPAARIAESNVSQQPERSTRLVVGLVIGVTVVSGFQVAQETFIRILGGAAAATPQFYSAFADLETALTSIMSVFSGLVGFSAIIAAVGLANNLSMSVVQRKREIGLLRALGFTRVQIRRMIVAESFQLTITAVSIGLALGVVYGWAAAQALLGAIPGAQLEAPAVPGAYVVSVVAGTALIAAVAAAAPACRALRIAPIEALRAV